MRELILMADARAYDDWTRTSAVLALIANVNRDPSKGRPFKISDFHPMEGPPKPVQSNDFSLLKELFVKEKQ